VTENPTRFLFRHWPVPGEGHAEFVVDAEDLVEAFGRWRELQKEHPGKYDTVIDVWSLEKRQKSSRWRHRRTYLANSLSEPQE